MQDWFTIDWFSWSRFSSLGWARPYMLYWLFSIPVLFIIRSFFQSGNRVGLPIAPIEGKLKLDWTRHFRALPPILFSIASSLLIIALARPQLATQTQNRISEGIDIILGIDISESMLTKDVSPNRLEASKKIARKFIEGREQDRIGIVVFSGEAFSLSPLTADYEALYDYIDEINPKLISADGTAIGSALAIGISRLMKSVSPSKVMILISDGDNTAGNLDPIAAAQLAKVYNVKLYTILVGISEGSVKTDSLSNTYSQNIDSRKLNEIAKVADGKFFQATNSKALKEVFEQINLAEKIKYEENSTSQLVDVYHVYLRWGIVFLLLTFATKITFIGNILED